MRKIGKITLLLALSCAAWSQYPANLFVASDGSAEYRSIQQAIDDAKSFPDQCITIFIKEGIYQEKLIIPSWNPNIHLLGANREKTIIRWDDHFTKMNRSRNSTFHTATLKIEGESFRASNLTIENTAGDVGQALAVFCGADRAVFNNCTISGNQDALYVTGRNARQLYYNCRIEGTTDFIFGNATALFIDCDLYCKKKSYITAASTDQGKDYGLVFIRCNVSGDPDLNSVYLGRPWRKYAKTVFIECYLGKQIHPDGWHDWHNAAAEKTSFYAEYRNHGPGADTQNRVGWSHQLSAQEQQKYTPSEVLHAFSLPEFKFDDILKK